MSSLCAPSLASLAVSLVAGRRACTMSMPMRSRMMPPAIIHSDDEHDRLAELLMKLALSDERTAEEDRLMVPEKGPGSALG